MADETTTDQPPMRSIPIYNAKGEEKWMNVPADMPKAQIHANMREKGVTHRPMTTSTTTTPTTTDQAPAQAETKPGWLGAAGESALDQVLTPIWEATKHQVADLGPNALAERETRIQQGGGGLIGRGKELLRGVGDVGALTAPLYAPVALGSQVAAQTVARQAGMSRPTAELVGNVAGMAEPFVETGLAGRNPEKVLTTLGEQGKGAYTATRDAVSRNIEDVISNASARGVELDPAQRANLASKIDALYPSKGTLPVIDGLETHLLDAKRPMTFADLDRYHTEMATKLPLSRPSVNKFTRAQDYAVSTAIRDAQTDALTAHPDLHGQWTQALDDWGSKVTPARRQLGPLLTDESTIEARAGTSKAKGLARAGKGIPEVQDALDAAQRVAEAQRTSGKLATLAPVVAALGGAGAGAGYSYHQGERDPLAIASGALASLMAEEAWRHGRVGAATPAGQAATRRLMSVAPETINQAFQNPTVNLTRPR